MGNPDQGAPEEVVEKTREVLEDSKTHRYSRSKGIPHLLREVGNYYKNKYDVNLDPENEIVATIGSKEGLSHLSLALLGPGDSALIPAPSFPIHIWSVVLAGANVITVSMEKLKENFIDHLFQTYESLWPKPKVLLLNFPHNPTTTVVDRHFYREVVNFALKKELILINDFAYADITFDGYKAPSLLEIPNAKKVGVEFITMSKSFSMAGWRVGFCLGNSQIVKALEKIKGYYDYGIFTPIQVGAIIALRNHWDTAPAAYAALYQNRRDVLVEGLNKIGWDIEKPKATMFVWAPIPKEYKKVGSVRFSQFLLNEAEVCASPGISFGEEGEGFLRISLVENEKRIQQAVRQIKKAMQSTSPDEVMEKYSPHF
jgi:alanine-synthesizing transaminase